MVPHVGREAAESARIYVSAERVARAGHYDNPILLVACDISKSVTERLVRRLTPFECCALGMKCSLQNPTLPFHPDMAAFSPAIVKLDHGPHP
jgi:hypothetical protein